MRMQDVLNRHPMATLFDLYPMQDRIEAIAHDRVAEKLNNQDSTTRRIARARMATLANLEGAPFLWTGR